MAGLTNSGAIKLYDLDALKERNATTGMMDMLQSVLLFAHACSCTGIVSGSSPD